MQTKIENIPAELKALPCWVCWQGQNKIPKNPANGRNAQSNNKKTWETVLDFVDDVGMYLGWSRKRDGYYRKINAEYE